MKIYSKIIHGPTMMANSAYCTNHNTVYSSANVQLHVRFLNFDIVYDLTLKYSTF